MLIVIVFVFVFAVEVVRDGRGCVQKERTLLWIFTPGLKFLSKTNNL